VNRRVVLFFACAGIAASAPQTPAPNVRTTVDRYCVGCHNQKVKTAGIALDGAGDSDVWEKVDRKLRTRSMPPAGLPRPDEATYVSVVNAVETTLDRAAAAHPNPGRTDTFRRLNRTEYRNSIRDLLALNVDIAALLPADDASHGFDNVTVGELSPTLLERYVTAARRISRLALGRPVKSPGGDTVTLPPDLTQEQPFDEFPLGTRGGLRVPYTFPVDAEYEINVRLTRDRNEHVEGLTEAHDIEILVDRARVALVTVKPPPPGNDFHLVDKDLNIRVPVSAGPHVVAATFPKRTSVLLETERQPYQAHFNMDRHPRIQPAVYSISVNGPYNAKGAGDTPSRRRLLICSPKGAAGETACASKILSTLMRRAYRRPVTTADLQVPLRFFDEGRRDGGFEAGIEMGLRAVLVSPEFLFRVEQDPAGVAPQAAYRVGDLALASRLSFFLWSSVPDDALLDAAVAGKLRDRAELERQTRRMLADPRSEALVNNFADQWLYLRNLDSIKPDMRAFPDFDDNLRQAMRRETELLFESVMREDRSIVDLLRANYTFLNERLAKHYGIPNVYGSRFRLVTLDGDRVRGGLLRQGSILMVTSYPTRTSPVIRGKWILSNILGIPPPPPPPNVPTLQEKTHTAGSVSMRARMAEHRDNPACSGCHKLMDPVGFSLENFDAVGRWRQMEDGKPIDASGGLPDGSKFEGVAGLEQALLRHPDAFATTFSEKLLTYALGRGVETYDGPAVRQIVRRAEGEDLRFSSFILGIVTSTPFEMRRSQ
jgi:hypothetical protein